MRYAVVESDDDGPSRRVYDSAAMRSPNPSRSRGVSGLIRRLVSRSVSGDREIRHRVAHRAGRHRELHDVAVAEVARAEERAIALRRPSGSDIRPSAAPTRARRTRNDSAVRSAAILRASAPRSERSALDLQLRRRAAPPKRGIVSMLIEPAYAAVPLLLVPTPRCTCTEPQAVREIGKVGEVQAPGLRDRSAECRRA